MSEWLGELMRRLFPITEEEAEALQKIEKANAKLAQFGGVLHISERGTLSYKFKTEQGRREFYKWIHEKNEHQFKEVSNGPGRV